jgi:hypothetical protein
MATVTQEFHSAPMGKRVLFPTVFTFSILGAVLAFNVLFVLRGLRREPFTDRITVALAPLVGLSVVVPIFLFERAKVARFRIEENCLVLGRKRFPLEGVVEVQRDPEVMRWAIKQFANGGLGSLRGSFRSKRLGKFYAFMTGTENAVILRWPDKVVAVSPADPEFFIYSVRSAAGLR